MRQHMGVGTRKGYEWARAHGIADVNYSKGNSQSFNAGVRAYAREQRKAATPAPANTTGDFQV